MSDIKFDFDLVKEFDRLVAEGGSGNPYGEIHLESRYDCNRGLHKWKWYVGFHLERYYFCDLCDTKDETRFPPSS